jgi:hypothetical protein
MKTQQRPGFEQSTRRPLRRSAARTMSGLIGLALALAACAPSPINEEPRYPEKRRPPPLRSASDGEVMGANGQSPEDTLEGSPTNLHPAPGWEGEKGAMERAREKEAADCDPDAPKAKTAGATTTNDASPTVAKASAAGTNETNPGTANASATTARPRSNKPCPKPAAH